MDVASFLCDFLLLIFRTLKVYTLLLWRCVVPQAQKDVRGEVVLVTGAGSGIGREVALRLARRGAKLALLDISKKGLDQVTAEIGSEGGFARQYICDVTNSVTVAEVAQRIEDEVGDVTILINNAGVGQVVDILSISEEMIQQTFEVNILAYFRFVKTFLPKMFEKNAGHIVNVASMTAFIGIPYIAQYCSSKSAVWGLTNALREEIRLVHQKNVKVTGIYPYFIRTNIVKPQCMIPGRFGRIQPVDEAADAIVDGILREQHEVYLPGHYRQLVTFAGSIPIGVQQAFRDFIGFGVVPEAQT